MSSAAPGGMFASPCYKVGQAFLPVRADRNVCATLFRAFSHTPTPLSRPPCAVFPRTPCGSPITLWSGFRVSGFRVANLALTE